MLKLTDRPKMAASISSIAFWARPVALAGLTCCCLALAFLLGHSIFMSQLKEQAGQGLQKLALSQAKALNEFYQNQSLALAQWSSANLEPQGAAQLQTAATRLSTTLKPKLERGDLIVALKNFYVNDFSPRFTQATGSSAGAAQLQVDQLDPVGLALQYVGLVRAAVEPNDYNTIATALDASIAPIAQSQGWSDVLIVHADTAQVLYSSSRGIELGASLSDGPIARTVLGELFQNTIAGRSVAMSDLDRHVPALGKEVFFIAHPIVVQLKVIAVVIAQIPASKMQSVLTANSQWFALGLGSTGDIQLVSADHAPRNPSRLMLVDPAMATEQLRGLIPDASISAIRVTGSESSLRRIETEGSRAALGQALWQGSYLNFARHKVVGASAKVDAFNQRYSVLVEQLESESVPANPWLGQILPALFGFVSVACIAKAWRKSVPSPTDAGARQKAPNSQKIGHLAPTVLATAPHIAVAAVVPVEPPSRTQPVTSLVTKQVAKEASSSNVGAPALLEACVRQARLQETQAAQILRTLDIIETLNQNSAKLALNTSLTANSAKLLTESDAQQLAVMSDELHRLAISTRQCIDEINAIATTQLTGAQSLTGLQAQLQDQLRRQRSMLDNSQLLAQAKSA
jgi:hypothetical protein